MKRRILIILSVVLALVLALSVFMLVRYYIQTGRMHKSNDAAAEIAHAEIPSLMDPTEPDPPAAQAPQDSDESSDAPAEPSAEDAPETEAPEVAEERDPIQAVVDSMLAVDLPALQAVNPDVLGWIAIPDTELSYPLLQAEDNEYYLNTTWDLQQNQAGAIFLDYTSQPDLSGFHTIVYGHRWNDDSMFGSLKYYADKSYRDEHPYVFLSIDGKCNQYEIFAAYEASIYSLTYLIRFDSEQMTRDFLNFCLSQSVWDPGMYLEMGDQILTLSTCTGTGIRTTRWVVQAKLVQTYTAAEP